MLKESESESDRPFWHGKGESSSQALGATWWRAQLKAAAGRSCRWYSYLNFLRYAWSTLMINQFQGTDSIINGCIPSAPSTPPARPH